MPREIYKDSDLVALNWYDEDGETIRGKIDQIREYEDGTRTILITSSDYGTIELPFSQDNISKLKNLEISEAHVSTMLKRSDKKKGGTERPSDDDLINEVLGE
jgi:pyrimidine operon attenuation protein/uracil phosphoribosyltransferase